MPGVLVLIGRRTGVGFPSVRQGRMRIAPRFHQGRPFPVPVTAADRYIAGYIGSRAAPILADALLQAIDPLLRRPAQAVGAG